MIKKILLSFLYTIVLMTLWLVIILYGTVSGWFHSPIAPVNTSQSFIKAAKAELEKQFVGNFAMAIMKNGEVELEEFYTAGKSVDRNTVFQVASLSKWISAFGIMKLVESGKLELDAPVSKYLTRWKLPYSEFNNDEVTVQRLLSHTAGLTDGLGYSGFEEGTPIQSIEQSLTKASDADENVGGIVRVGIKPGSEFKYSGGGYTLLQLIVEEVSEQSFTSYMNQQVFEPLGMHRSTYIWSDSSSLLAEFYNSDGTRAKHYRYTSLAATSLYTSLSDMELFFQAHLHGKNNEPVGRHVLKAETITMMRKPNAQQMGVDIWGLGTILYAATDSNDFIIGHDGKGTPPINTAVRLNPESGDGIIIFETGNPGIATRLASEWVFWKTGKVDTFLFPMLLRKMFSVIAIGWLVIIGGTILVSAMRRRSSTR